MTGSWWMSVGAILAGVSVATGALAAHGLEKEFVKKYAGQTKMVSGAEIPAAQKYLADFKTAAEYQMYHALAILFVGLCLRQQPSRLISAAGWSFLLGIILFSGMLYLLTVTGQTKLGMIVPLGGVAFLVGWGLLAAGVARGQT